MQLLLIERFLSKLLQSQKQAVASAFKRVWSAEETKRKQKITLSHFLSIEVPVLEKWRYFQTERTIWQTEPGTICYLTLFPLFIIFPCSPSSKSLVPTSEKIWLIFSHPALTWVLCQCHSNRLHEGWKEWSARRLEMWLLDARYACHHRM